MNELYRAYTEALQHYNAGRRPQAEEVCRRILESDPDHRGVLLMLGVIALNAGRSQEAEELLARLVRLDGSSAAQHFNLAQALHAQGRIEEAAPAYRQTLRLAPGYGPAHYRLGLILQAQRQSDGAVRHLREALRLEPNSPATLFALGSELRSRGEAAEAAQLLAMVPEEDGNYVQARLELFKAECRLGRHPAPSAAGGLPVPVHTVAPGHTLDPLCRMIESHLPARPASSRPRVVYILRVTGRFGHLAWEPLLIRTFFDPALYDISILIFSPPETSANPVVFEMAFRGTTPVLVPSGPIAKLWGQHLGFLCRNDTIFALTDIGAMTGLLFEHMEQGGRPARFELTEAMAARGAALFRRIGIPDGAPLVTLHVREPGYVASAAHNSFRDADIFDYLPAIEYLTGAGYTVVRLGDPSMRRLPDLGKAVVDLPFHPAYDRVLDPYAVSRSRFMMNVMSGPEVLRVGFGVPGLITNCHFSHLPLPHPGDLFSFKDYRRRSDGRSLSYGEILDTDAFGFTQAREFDEAGLELVSQSPEEILAVTREMVERLDGRFRGNPALDRKAARLGRACHARRAADPVLAAEGANFYGFSSRRMQFAHAYLARVLPGGSAAPSRPERRRGAARR